MRHCKHLLPLLLSAACAAAAALTVAWPAAWTDEVMFGDTAYNLAHYGRWTTTAWDMPRDYCNASGLFTLALAAWQRLFGFTALSCRLMNVAGAVALLAALCRLLRRRCGVTATAPLAAVALLFWVMEGTRFVATHCRPDLLNALAVLLTVMAAWRWIEQDSATSVKHNWGGGQTLVLLGGAAVYSTGLQACPYLLATAAAAWIGCKERRRGIWRCALLAAAGMAAAFAAWGLMAWAHGTLHWYLYRPLEYSATAVRVLTWVLPLAGSVTGHDFSGWIAGVQPRLHGETLCDKMRYTFAQCPDMAWLPALLACLLALRLATAGRRGVSRGTWTLTLWALAAPAVMVLAGRMERYYAWMMCLPALMAVAVILQGWRTAGRGVAVAAVWCAVALATARPRAAESRSVQRCVAAAGIRKSDVVAASFSSFYAVKPLSDRCFFVQTYGTALPQPPDIIIVGHGDDWNTEAMGRVLREARRRPGSRVTLVSRCRSPQIEVYRVTAASPRAASVTTTRPRVPRVSAERTN